MDGLRHGDEVWWLEDGRIRRGRLRARSVKTPGSWVVHDGDNAVVAVVPEAILETRGDS